jgi:Pyruvate/2-oxoacid:ferredoxin oxidoreductase delta subunit
MGRLARVLAKSGYDPFMKRLGIEAVAFAEKVSTEFTDGRLFRRIDLAREVFEFDTVVNLPKLKTHCQMVVTLAVKNLFGVIVGTDKVSWHMRAGKDSDSFATVLVQILEKVRPALSIIDGILGMQGNGPTYGEPRHIGIVAASTDAVALDAELCRLVGIPLERVRTCVIGHELGLGRSHADEIDLIGDKLPGFPLRNFKPPKSMTVMWNLSAGNPVRKFMENHVITKPDIDTTACRTCGICMEHCPPRAISEQNGLMVIDRRKCISCFCCHELCVNNAVRIVQPFLGRCLAKINR